MQSHLTSIYGGGPAAHRCITITGSPAPGQRTGQRTRTHVLFANDAAEPLQIMVIQTGDYLGEDDIIRLDDDFGRD